MELATILKVVAWIAVLAFVITVFILGGAAIVALF